MNEIRSCHCKVSCTQSFRTAGITKWKKNDASRITHVRVWFIIIVLRIEGHQCVEAKKIQSYCMYEIVVLGGDLMWMWHRDGKRRSKYFVVFLLRATTITFNSQQRIFFLAQVVYTRYVCRNKNRFSIVHRINNVARHSVSTWIHYEIDWINFTTAADTQSPIFFPLSVHCGFSAMCELEFVSDNQTWMCGALNQRTSLP